MKSQEIGGVSVRLPHVCKECGIELEPDGSNFPIRWSSGQRYYRFLCRKCFNRYSGKRKSSIPGFGAYKERHKAKRRSEDYRKSAGSVLHDLKRYDRRHGLVCDLTRDVIERLISEGCQYCEAERDEIRIGLDRIDNSQGHTKNNVVPCCTRCNLVRGSMPYEAWRVVAEGMKQARKAGLFKDWIPGNKKKISAHDSLEERAQQTMEAGH